MVDLFVNNYDDILKDSVSESKEIISNYKNLQNEYQEYLVKYSVLNHEVNFGSFNIFDSSRLDAINK